MTSNVARRLAAQPEPTVSDQFKLATLTVHQSSGRTSGWQRKGSSRVAFAASFGLAGLLLGAALEPKCHCDDQGIKGAMIGLPVGVLFGAWLGGR
jgi:hypothetical protein